MPLPCNMLPIPLSTPSSPTNPSNISSTPLKRMHLPTTNTSRNVPSVLSCTSTQSLSVQSHWMMTRCQMSISLHLYLKFSLTTTLHHLKPKRTSTEMPTLHVKSKLKTMPCRQAATSMMPPDVPVPSLNPSPQSSNLQRQHALRQSLKDLRLHETVLAAATPTTLASRTTLPAPTPLPAWIRVMTKVITTPIYQDGTATMMRNILPSGHHLQWPWSREMTWIPHNSLSADNTLARDGWLTPSVWLVLPRLGSEPWAEPSRAQIEPSQATWRLSCSEPTQVDLSHFKITIYSCGCMGAQVRKRPQAILYYVARLSLFPLAFHNTDIESVHIS